MSTLHKEIGNKIKIALTILFFIFFVSSIIYLFCCDEILIESKMVIQDDGQYVKEDVFRRVDFIYLVQWVIVISFVATVWMWRLKFGITGFIGIQGPDIGSRSHDDDVCEEDFGSLSEPTNQSETTSSAEPMSDDVQSPSPPMSQGETTMSVETVSDDIQSPSPSENQDEMTPSAETKPSNNQLLTQPMSQSDIVLNNRQFSSQSQASINLGGTTCSNTAEIKRTENLSTEQNVVALLEKYQALSVHKIASILGLPIKKILDITKNNPQLFRMNGEEQESAEVITYAQSAENNAIQKFINSRIHEKIISDTRPAQVNHFEADAIILTEKDVYLLEVKRSYTPHVPIFKAIRELRFIASQFHNVKIHIVLIYLEKSQNEKFFCKDRAMVKEVLRSQKIDLQVYLVSELEKKE